MIILINNNVILIQGAHVTEVFCSKTSYLGVFHKLMAN